MKPPRKQCLLRAQLQAHPILTDAVGPELKGLTSHPEALLDCDSHSFFDLASIPVTTIYSNTLVFNFKDILTEEALLPDDSLKFMIEL